MADALQDYEEYVEGWAHEAKTPLSLLTMLLDNRNDESLLPCKQSWIMSAVSFRRMSRRCCTMPG